MVAGYAGRNFVSDKTKAFRRSVNAGMSRLKSTKFSFLIGPNTEFYCFSLYIIYTQRTTLLFDSLFILIKYSSESSDRGLTTVFYALDNDYCYLYMDDQPSWK